MKVVLYILAAGLFLPACKKDAPEASLPAATQVGANTAGCLIDGKPFIAASYGGGLLSSPIPALDYGFSFDSLYYLIINGNYSGKRATVTLFLRTRKVGEYILNKNTQYYPAASPLVVANSATFAVEDSNGETYVTSSLHTGRVVITKADVSDFIAAGTFEFVAASNFDPRKTVAITNGRFDRKD